MSDEEIPVEDERITPWQGLFWPLMSVVGGLVAYFLLFGGLVDPLNPAAGVLKDASYKFVWEVSPPPNIHAILAADMNARYAIAIPSVLMSLSFLATLVMVFRLVLPPFGWIAITCGVLALPIGGVVGYLEQYNNTLRAAVANCAPSSADRLCPLDQAVLRAGDLGTFRAENLDQVLMLTTWNSVISVAAIFLLGISFVFLARPAVGTELSPEMLRARKDALLTTIVLGAMVLVFAVATADGFYHLAPGLMTPEDSRTMGALGSAGASYWGAVYTTVILVIAAPPAFSIVHDVARAAARAKPDGDYQARQTWSSRNGLALRMRETIAPLIAGVSPLLTTPVLNVLSPILTS